MPEVGVVIAGGGMGVRLGSRTPKQFLRIHGKMVIEHVASTFARMKEVGQIVVVVPAQYRNRVLAMAKRTSIRKITAVVSGGERRQESVWNGLQGFAAEPDIVLVHDAARLLVTPRVIRDVILETERFRAAVVGNKVSDTIKREGPSGFYAETLPREGLWAVQTPQGFQYDLLKNAHQRAQRDSFIGTDDASLVERLGIPVRIVEGDRKNIKITNRNDLEIVQKWLKRR